MKPGKPSLAQIEADWFRPSDRLISRISNDDPDTPPELRFAVENNPEFKMCIQESYETETEDSGYSPGRAPPEYLLNLADRRHTAQESLKNATLKPGAMVAIDRLIGPSGELSIDLPKTAVVLLDGIEHPSGIWYGWMVGAEAGYATNWDYVLLEEDGHFDPSLAGMAQLWNPVRVYVKSIARIVGEISNDRLQAVRALAAEFLTRPDNCEAYAGPGAAGPRRTLHGYKVVTGKPVRGQSDPRWRYQEIYLAVKSAVGEPAKAAMALKPWWEAIWAGFQNSFTSEEPAMAYAMGETPHESLREGILADRFRVGLDNRIDKVMRVRFTRIGDHRSTIRLLRNGEVSQTMAADDRNKIFLLDDSGRFSLEISDAEGNLLDQLDLTETGED